MDTTFKFDEYLIEVSHDDDDGDETIASYKCWSDEESSFTSLTDRQASYDDFIAKLILKVDDLIGLDFTVNSQAKYLQKLKEDLPLNKIIILLNFAENYSFV